MKKLIVIILTLFVSSYYPALYAQKKSLKTNSLFQYSILNALMIGDYDGSLSLKQLSHYGDFGLGTFDKLDGEMVAFDGKFYQISSDGVAKRVLPSFTTPFAEVTFFKPKQRIALDKTLSCSELYSFLDSLRASANRAVAIKITGEWATLKTRSVRAQSKPYPPLSEAVAKQAVFEFANIKATLVGFWLPSYLASVNSAGYHFHALTADKKSGGHVLDCTLTKAVLELDALQQFHLALPEGFDALNFSKPTVDLQHP
ncbi:MAG: acetolactate decarboxylase [Methylococcaceae bacterium]